MTAKAEGSEGMYRCRNCGYVTYKVDVEIVVEEGRAIVPSIPCPRCDAIDWEEFKAEGKIEGEYRVVALMEEGSMIRMLLRGLLKEEGSAPKVLIEKIPKSDVEVATQAMSEGMVQAFRTAVQEGYMSAPRSPPEISMYMTPEQYIALGSPPLYAMVKLTFEVRK